MFQSYIVNPIIMKDLKTIRQQVLSSEPFVKLKHELQSFSAGTQLQLRNVSGSLLAFVAATVFEQCKAQVVLIASDEEKAEKLRDDCATLLGETQVSLFGFHPAHAATLLDMSSPIAQIETLKKLSAGNTLIVVASPHSIVQPVPPPEKFQQQTIELSVGQEYNFQQLIEQLLQLGFEKKDFVEHYGDIAVRGGILDVFSFVGENPVRFEFWGNTIESIREFDVLSQRSIRKLDSASVVPSFISQNSDSDEQSQQISSASLFDYLEENAVIILDEPAFIEKEIEELFKEGAVNLFSYTDVLSFAQQFSKIESTTFQSSILNPKSEIEFHSTSQPSLNGSINLLVDSINRLTNDGYNVYLTCDTKNEAERLSELLEEEITKPEEVTGHGLQVPRARLETENRKQETVNSKPETPNPKPVTYHIVAETLHSGFIFPPAKIAVFTEHEIFGRLKRRGAGKRKRFKGFSQKELQQLRRGDYVTHVDRGIGQFIGLNKIKVAGVEQEVMKLMYDEGGVMYVNLASLMRVQKYASKEGFVPKLNKLGSGDWERVTGRAKKRIKDIARDLIKLYAKRKLEQGYSFASDSHWQKELEASFMYEDTPDQARTTLEVKRDMEDTAPMDRLVCGDVGFGKTEVAVRAAFKAVSDGKQVAVLVPTTILAMQHYNTFMDRLSKYTVRVEHLNRFRTTREQKAIVEGMKSGTVDVIIGTHRLLSKDIGFKDLGLLIIDEEHRFGVSAKERLRQFRAAVDTLSMTATPIPRTLQFSLLGARDLSIIATPPRNRLPIQTEMVPFGADGKQTHWNVAREAIIHELYRGGQVYFVHDRVENIDAIADQLRSKIPEAKVHVAHGQMEGHELEKTMLDFLEKKYDVLVCTKIIESGLDIPSVNTIIINRADRFGMAELHQLRGRVGRSNVQAYAYLFTPPLSVVPKSTLRRLQAIEEFNELGSGFNLSMRDLEIRGAGNLLGAEQSGFVADMGFEMYEQILREAVEELKQEEFKELFKDQTPTSQITYPTSIESVVDIDVDAFIPDFYIESDTERLDIYRRLSKMLNEQELNEMRNELQDRFGEYPEEVEHLLLTVLLRLLATQARFQKLEVKGNILSLTLPPETDTEFYGNLNETVSPFQKLIAYISQQPKGAATLEQQAKELKVVVRLKEQATQQARVEAAVEKTREIVVNLSLATDVLGK
ncbi:MAG: transcription-repair coupling factor [Ignavibacteriae bacterium]|nr:transcription-repair coupling factor [Ignavibacteriota bacterium]